MSISNELKLEIKKYYSKNFTIRDKQEGYNLREIYKYVIYCNDIINNNRDKVGLTEVQFIQPTQELEVGYGQLEHISFGMSLDPKMPLDSFILNVIDFMETNNFKEDKILLVKKFIDDYNIFMQPIEYKSPIYLTIAYLCIMNTTKQDVMAIQEEGIYYDEEIVDRGEESDEDLDDYEYDEEEFGEDEDW